ncbi:MAG TPA: (Fe-S)-binding protein, partial [Saprospiraceae bacterium]|nr:(Fe-S)-binding protein [Saprospiraceae bacterium]
YPALGGDFKVIHHSEYLQELIADGKIRITDEGEIKGKKLTYHDSCYIGRGHDIYEAPREVLNALNNDIIEMKRCKSDGLCCGAGGAQMFKEDEPGNKRINTERAEEAIHTGAEVIAANCPFCITMLEDGIKEKDAQEKVTVLDLAEIIADRI